MSFRITLNEYPQHRELFRKKEELWSGVKNLRRLFGFNVNHSHMDLFLIMQVTQPSRRILKWSTAGSISRPLE